MRHVVKPHPCGRCTIITVIRDRCDTPSDLVFQIFEVAYWQGGELLPTSPPSTILVATLDPSVFEYTRSLRLIFISRPILPQPTNNRIINRPPRRHMLRIRRINKMLPPIDNKRIDIILLAFQRVHHDHRPRHEFRILHAIPHAARRLKLRLRQWLRPSLLISSSTIQYRFLLLLMIAYASQVLPYFPFVPFQFFRRYIIPPLDQRDRATLDMSQMRIVNHGRHPHRIRPVRYHPYLILQRLHPALRSPFAGHVAVRTQYDHVVRHVLLVLLGQ
mmetsp:Transcript_19020/g.29813  ORF Transcript_19020/g.29813 Transcript_19020/m.29813 type:complete len:274 (-) Transcript_19020:855-1676(-)